MRICIMCRNDISGKRADATTCSANCRKQLSRQKAKIERATAKIKADIMALHKMAIDDETEESVTKAMVTLRKYLDAGFVIFESEQKKKDDRAEIDTFLESRRQAMRDARRSHV